MIQTSLVVCLLVSALWMCSGLGVTHWNDWSCRSSCKDRLQMNGYKLNIESLSLFLFTPCYIIPHLSVWSFPFPLPFFPLPLFLCHLYWAGVTVDRWSIFLAYWLLWRRRLFFSSPPRPGLAELVMQPIDWLAVGPIDPQGRTARYWQMVPQSRPPPPYLILSLRSFSSLVFFLLFPILAQSVTHLGSSPSTPPCFPSVHPSILLSLPLSALSVLLLSFIDAAEIDAGDNRCWACGELVKAQRVHGCDADMRVRAKMNWWRVKWGGDVLQGKAGGRGGGQDKSQGVSLRAAWQDVKRWESWCHTLFYQLNQTLMILSPVYLQDSETRTCCMFGRWENSRTAPLIFLGVQVENSTQSQWTMRAFRALGDFIISSSIFKLKGLFHPLSFISGVM